MGTLLEVEGLRVLFHTTEGVVHAVNGISYSMQEGETVALVGESGCGKSVSMMSILRLIPCPPGEVAEGRALFGQRDLLQLGEAELERIRGGQIGMVFQDPMTSLNPVLTIGRQITETLRAHTSSDAASARTRTLELLDMVGLPAAEDRLQDYPHQFSGGMRQRAMIAMALACSPKLLIADEPTTALDVTIQAQIVELALKLRERLGMAIIWITHDLGVVAGLADRVLVMYAGYLVEEAPVHELFARPWHPYTLALLAALPRVDRPRSSRLKPIPGSPPNLLAAAQGCPFVPRCDFAMDRCRTENPPLVQIEAGRKLACWANVETGQPR
jgi:oligopeptide/dipeptide ABC transporter ATP-binding protein